MNNFKTQAKSYSKYLFYNKNKDKIKQTDITTPQKEVASDHLSNELFSISLNFVKVRKNPKRLNTIPT